MANKVINKKAQVTVFIIIALLIIIAIVLVFVLFRQPRVEVSPSADPESYIEKCIEDYTKEAVDILAETGGDIEPEGTLMYNGEEIVYLCYTASFYQTCVNQRPLLIEHIESEITNYIKPKIEECFSSLRGELIEKGYSVDYEDLDVRTELQTKKIVVTVDRQTTISKGDDVRKINSYKEGVNHPIYDLAEIAMEIVNQESRYCNFDILGFMIFYPNYDIQKLDIEDGTIYIIKELTTDKEFKFAIRSCALPAGF